MTTSPPVLSARAQKRAKVVGEIGSDDKAKGLVRTGPNGVLEHSSDEGKTWVAAIYHNDLRAELIQEAAQVGQYDHERNYGAAQTDITSFLASQKSWGPDRIDWPDVLFQIEVEKNTDLPKTVPIWYRKGRLVIDHDNHPMREFLGVLPVTLSSEAEGWLLEAFTRSNSRVQIKDLRGRMPKEIAVVDKTGTASNTQQTKPLFTPRTITQRTLRFRGHAGLKARDVRGGSDTINKGLEALIPAEALKMNNTKELGRLITSEEVKAFKKPNEGRYPQRGRAKKSVPSTSSKRKRDVKDVARQGEVSKENKRARVSRNAAFPGEGSLLAEGQGVEMFTSELSSTAMPTPDYEELSTPGDLDYLSLDPTLFSQDELAFQQWLLQESTQSPAAPEEGDKWSDLLNLSPQEAYNLMNANSNQNQGLNVDLNRTYGPVTYGQPYQTQVAPHTNYVDGVLNHGWGSTTTSVHDQVHQTPGASKEHHHGQQSEGTPNQSARSRLDSVYAQPYHASVASRAIHAPIEEGALYPEFGTSTYLGYAEAHKAPPPRFATAQTHACEGTSYLNFGASTPMMYSQIPTAAIGGQNHKQNAGASLAENTALRIDRSLPTARPTTGSSARKSGKGKGRAQKHGTNLTDTYPTPPAVQFPFSYNELHTASSGDYPPLPTALNTIGNVTYTTYDGTPVYHSTGPYFSGSSLEPAASFQGEGAGAQTGGLSYLNPRSDSIAPKPTNIGLSTIEEFHPEPEHLRR